MPFHQGAGLGACLTEGGALGYYGSAFQAAARPESVRGAVRDFKMSKLQRGGLCPPLQLGVLSVLSDIGQMA